jgi:gamma-glutamyltranspeptidase/glutathione hydrolase
MLAATPALPGAALIQMVQIAEAGGAATMAPGSADFIDLQSRAWQVADKSVQTYFGDPDFVDVPTETLTDPAANALLADTLAPAAAAAVSSPYVDTASNTTHISVVDSDGMAVSMTNTVTGYWGSGQYVAGFFMNDQLLRFNAVGTGNANVPSPGRRSVSWSTPSMLLDQQGRPALIIGSPGGRQIPNSLAAVITRWALQGENLDDAIPAERFLLDAGVLRLETETLASEMRSRGYTVDVTPESSRYLYGSVQALEVDWDTGEVLGVADPRRAGAFATDQQ